ncbi:MAG: polysaccharide biosynthesis C-terminal domain-containing protein [Elusimicrobia bacterium]|nr:polysaccharide biosynthesis C-terminal domain-containing protein [Elusimicrobiota bacterium]
MTSSRGAKSFRFARSVGFGFVGQALSFLVNFCIIPVLIRAFGTETYGLYILLHTTTSFALLATLGASTAVVRTVAERKAAGDGRALRQIASYASVFYAAAAVLGAGLAWGLAPRVAADVLRLTGATAAEAVFVIRAGAVAALGWTAFEMCLSFLSGLQLFGWQAAFLAAQGIVFMLGALAIVLSGRGLRAIAIWFAAWQFLLAAAAALVAGLKLRESLGPTHRGLAVRDFLSLALGGGSGRFAWVVTYQLDRIYIARAESLSDTTLYAVPAGLLRRLQLVRSVVANVTIPMMSELSGPTAREELRRMYMKSTRFVLWSALPALVFLFAVMPQLLGLWLGVEFAGRAVWPARILVLLQIFYFLEGEAHTLIIARDRPWRLDVLIWLQAVVSIVGWKLLIARWGLVGVAVGSTLAQALTAAIAIRFAHRRLLGLSWSEYASQVLLAPALSAALALGAIWPARTAVTTWPRVALAILVVSAVYYGSTYALMSAEDRELLHAWLAGFRRRLRAT